MRASSSGDFSRGLLDGRFDRFEIPGGRPVGDRAIAVKPRPVTRAVPGFLSAVPVHGAAQMGAHCRAFVKVAGLISIGRNFFQPVANDSTRVVWNVLFGSYVSAGDPRTVTRRVDQVVSSKSPHPRDPNTRR